MIVKIGRVGLIEVLLGLLDWRTGGRYGLSSHMVLQQKEHIAQKCVRYLTRQK